MLWSVSTCILSYRSTQFQGGIIIATSTRTPKPQLTLDGFQTWLDDAKISVKKNVISHDLYVTGIDPIFDRETVRNNLHVILHDALKQKFICNVGLVSDLLMVVGGLNSYNPVIDLLASAPPWDGQNHIEYLYDSLHIRESDKLSRTLIRKWLMQTRAIASNDLDHPFGADGMLVLVGPQGIGKTTVPRVLAMKPELVKTGMWIDTRDKDTLIRTTSCWIAELGEVETTLRSDLERLKAFITAELDQVRLPYGRRDEITPRRTSLIATCNSNQFLIDPTGSRRFWTVPISYIDLPALKALDVIQLWKQVETLVAADPQGFRLTPIEQAELARRNTQHEKPLKAQMEVQDIFAEADEQKNSYRWEFMTVSDFKLDYPSLSRYTVEQVAKALDKLGVKQERKSIGGKQSRVRLLPVPLYGKAQTA